MTFNEYRAVMDELKIPKLKSIKGQKFSAKEKKAIKLGDFRFLEKYLVGFSYEVFPKCIGEIPTTVIMNTYYRLGRECFRKGDSFETLCYGDLRDIDYIASFKIGTLRDFLVFFDELLRYYSYGKKLKKGEVRSIDVNDTYARIMSKVFELNKSNLSKTPREFMNKKFKPFRLQTLDSVLDEEKENIANLLDEYDKAVNPLLDDSFELGNIYDFAKRKDVSVSPRTLDLGQYNKDYTSYEHGTFAVSFDSKLMTIEGKRSHKPLETMKIVHRFFRDQKASKINFSKVKEHETLEITKFDKNNNLISTGVYDLTNGSVVGYFYGEKMRDISIEELRKISSDLQCALSIISERNKSLGTKTLKLECNEQNNN